MSAMMYRNWNNPYYPDDLDRQDYVWPDEEVEYKEHLPNVEWLDIWAVSCWCNKFIKIDDMVQAEYFRNTMSFCTECGKTNWMKGVYSFIKIKNREDLKKYADYTISPRDKEILRKMKYL